MSRRCASSGRRPVAADPIRRCHRRHRLESEPRADRVGPVADEAGDRVGVVRLVRLHDERAPRAQTDVREACVNRREREQGGNGRTFATRVAVGQADDGDARFDGGLGEREEPIDRVHEALVLGERRVEPGRLELLEPGRVQQERGKHREPGQRAFPVERVGARA